MRTTIIAEVVTAALGFAGIACSLNDRTLSERCLLRWIFFFGGITALCLLSEARLGLG